MKNRLIKKLQGRLAASADPKKRNWFNNYLKGAIEYRGVPTPEIKNILKSWLADYGMTDSPPDKQMELSDMLFAQSFAEDKFAGIFLLQNCIDKQPSGKTLGFLKRVFRRGDIYDWSTNDWLCVRVLDPLILKNNDKSAERIAKWRSAKNLWQKRSSIVAFRGAGRVGLHHNLIAEIIEDLADSSERFIQTGIGWCLSDMSRNHTQTARKLFNRHFDRLSLEVIDRHTKHLPEHKDMKTRKRKELSD